MTYAILFFWMALCKNKVLLSFLFSRVDKSFAQAALRNAF